jgi:hypothetical protein
MKTMLSPKGYRRRRRVSRRRFLRQAACAGLALGGASLLQAACAPRESKQSEETPSDSSLSAESTTPIPSPPAQAGDRPAGTNQVRIADIGTFAFDAGHVTTVRSDIFQPGHFSLFDILVHLDERGDIKLDSHFDESEDTHVIDAINGERGWWYDAYYSAGWREFNAFRMDMYPYKNRSHIRLFKEREGRLEGIHRSFQDEVARLARNGGQVVIPKFDIRGPSEVHSFEDVVVTPHNVRLDLLQPGVVTAVDALLSLEEQAKLSDILLTWYEVIGRADPVDSYWVNSIGKAVASGTCGFVYETGPLSFAGFGGTHIHIPADARVTISPEYALWFWICL